MNFNKIQKIAAIAIASLFLAVTAQAAAQAWETFQVNGGYALNTNNSFRLIEGNPRMSIYQHNSNDPDQQFDISSNGKWGTLLRHRSTGKCLNAHYLADNREINVWPCNGNDVDQNWHLENVGNGEFLIRRSAGNSGKSDFCVDSPSRSNNGRIHLIKCERNNANQRWKSSANVVATTWKLPWRGGPVSRNQTWHTDGYGLSSLDFGLNGGQAVLAPIKSTVISACNAGNNHWAIQLQASNGQYYSLIHVAASSISRGKTYNQGDQIGVVASLAPLNPKCAVWTGVHLHMGFPSKNFSIDGYNLTPSSLPSSFRSSQ
ncbi:MAG: ricin-type beta-trefoil lectin domain protein [Microcoleus sp. PH2017_10_PVI_O_A]|uniref:ricin-type beta-trefoil lectin domain protein n=1 Tax=unclassified Microcoleus TaxID=2642155 RepID=UPI001D8D7F4D|nr:MULTISPECIES: ricin-type beta-trefoil lectin domain protein [unclassified Microcoleus]MCC3406624.1 ricin-type beta-trefoil lectin domain protein [Microcoleus sp. PH2017_10_PVI_O_A]MCC3460636.1 ricin-type beta-trefoil lectin domain protein [Microcoleus sp. PH2017_11_PCY_U_A]MCC3479183.1 ricin-type beta-trefoil lectin domain protein [Microcoleus sp. PH2017_12_PCY_D_A]MCC3560024.1 ricin-type beta-trefoil lectin domain protein [Microcoleus sp. PH2017_27_LUM_O_A]